jgi:hypothetical protein
MWDLDDKTKYKKLFEFEIDKIYTWGSSKDKERREEIRQKATQKGIVKANGNKGYAFRISIHICSKRPHRIDIDNTVKLILDSFSKKVDENNSKYPDCWLYEDDCYPNVKVIEVGAAGKVDSEYNEKMVVEVFELK